MPILVKNDRQIYFAHIPKTAGTSIYLAFAAAGWTIENLSQNRAAQSAFSLLRDSYGITRIARRGRMFRFPHPPQHVPRIIWRTWGPFEDSFAVVRHPMARLKSALKYHHRISNSPETLADFAEQKLQFALARPWNHWRTLGGHMIPQSAYIGPDTHVLRFEEDWQQALCARYDLNPETLPVVNTSPPSAPLEFSARMQARIERRYGRDYRRFGYPLSAAN